MNNIIQTSPYYLQVLISLPYWLELPDNSKYYKKYKKNSYEIKIVQNLWRIRFITEIHAGSLILEEDKVIDPNFMRPKLNYDYYFPLSWYEKELNLKRQYYPEKLKTTLSINLKKKEFNDFIDVLGFLNKEELNIWEDIKNLVQFFISNYIQIKLSSNRTFHRVRLLGEKYFTPNNTYFYMVSFKEDDKTFLSAGTAILGITKEHNIPNFIANKTTVKMFRKKIYCSTDFKIKLKERLRILIDQAKIQRDMNSLIIYTTIYLERISIKYLEKKRQMKSWELDILFEHKGLRHFVKFQLPCLINEKKILDQVKEAVEIVEKRNEIIHLGKVFSYEKNIELKCNHVFELITYLEKSIRDKKKEVDYKFDLNLFGIFIETHKEMAKIGYLRFPESKSEQEYLKDYWLKFEEEVYLCEYNEIDIDNRHKSFSRVYNNKGHYYIYFALQPIDLDMNLHFFSFLMKDLEDRIKPEEITFNFCFIKLPPSFLDYIKTIFNLQIKEYQKTLGYQKIKINFLKLNQNNTK